MFCTLSNICHPNSFCVQTVRTLRVSQTDQQLLSVLVLVLVLGPSGL